VVTDALSRKVHCNHLEVESYSDALCEDMRKLQLEVVEQGNIYAIAAKSNLYDRIVTSQHNDEGVQQKIAEISRRTPQVHLFLEGCKTCVVWETFCDSC
jgi:hypothetical protein